MRAAEAKLYRRVSPRRRDVAKVLVELAGLWNKRLDALAQLLGEFEVKE